MNKLFFLKKKYEKNFSILGFIIGYKIANLSIYEFLKIKNKIIKIIQIILNFYKNVMYYYNNDKNHYSYILLILIFIIIKIFKSINKTKKYEKYFIYSILVFIIGNKLALF